MDFSNLQYFRTVAAFENLTRASKELYISQPGLSRYITRLEKEIGVPLFERRKGRIILNNYGKIFLDSVNQAFTDLNYGVMAVRNAYLQKQNILPIASSIEDFLTDRLKEFSDEHPEIVIRQHCCSISEIENQLMCKKIDLAICAHPPVNDKIKYEVLSQCPYVLVCNKDNPLSVFTEISLRDAENERFICDNTRFDRSKVESICRLCGFSPIISHEIESGYIMENLLATNAGVTLMPLAHFLKIVSHCQNNRLRAIRLKDNLPLAEIGVIYLAEDHLSAPAVLFLDYLRRWAVHEYSQMHSFAKELFAIG